MITTKDNIRLQQIEQNEPDPVMLGTKRIKIRMMNNTIAERFDRYTAEAEMSYSEDKKDLLLNMGNNRSLVPKCVSLLILHSCLKVNLFHWIYWRYLSSKYSQQELGGPLAAGFGLGEFQNYAQNLICLQDNSSMIQKMSKGIIRNTIAAPKSEPETTP